MQAVDVGERRMAEMFRQDEGLRDMMVVREKLGCRNDLSEVYSVPRVAEVAAELGLKHGFSLDLSRPTPSGYVWNFWRRECR